MSEINRFRWRTFVVIALAATALALSLYKIVAEPPVFFTTHSPSGVYTIHLSGQKERPVWFTVEVGFDVLKDGKAFWTDQHLHSGDAMDLSFEAGWPDHRWIGENVLQFYREKNFTEFKNPQNIVLVNRTKKVVKHLFLACSDKFLVFDLQPGSEIKLAASPPKGDLSGVFVEGEFYDGHSLKNSAVFEVKGRQLPLMYVVHITDSGIEFESEVL